MLKGFVSRCWVAITLSGLFLGVPYGFSAEPGAVRLPIEVKAAGVERIDKAVEMEISLEPLGGSTSVPVQLVEVDNAGQLVDPQVPFQLDQPQGTGQPTLTFLLKGETPANATRRFLLHARKSPLQEIESRLKVEDIGDYEGFPAFKITTPSATYYYHKRGSGFASLIDKQGNDWISYRPEGGFQGNYRGIPNIAPPNFHPGRPDGKKESKLIRSGPIRASILSETEDGQWGAVWDFFPSYATMTLFKKGEEPYWILYEGTPGGFFETEADYWVQSSGKRLSVAPNHENNRWDGKLPAPQWVYFGDSKLKQVLFLALHEPDDFPDRFWHRGSGGMTVFGFGRGPRPQWQYLQTIPAHLTIGFVEDDGFSEVRRHIESAWREVEVKAGPAEKVVGH